MSSVHDTITERDHSQVQPTDQHYSLLQNSILFLCKFHRTTKREGKIEEVYIWVGLHCSLYPPPPHTIHPPLADLVLGESVNCIPEVSDTRNSVTFKAHDIPARELWLEDSPSKSCRALTPVVEAFKSTS